MIEPDRKIQFHIFEQSWYAAAARTGDEVDSINVECAPIGEDDGVFWEFRIIWRTFNQHDRAVQVTLFDDAWAALTAIPEFFAWLASLSTHDTHVDGPTVPEVAAKLTELGYSDATERVQTPRGPRG